MSLPSGRPWVAVAAFVALLLLPAHAAPQYTRKNAVFQGSNTGTFHSFRVPALVHGMGNVLLLLAEGHVGSAGDFQESNLVYKRSTDNGATWGTMQTLAGETAGSWLYPTAVYEPSWGDPAFPKGKIHVFFVYRAAGFTNISQLQPGDMRIYYAYSKDDGLTFEPRVDLTNTLKLVLGGTQLAFDLVGPGIGIRRAQKAGYVGQLVVPALSRNFYSSNHGVTWTMLPSPSSTDAADFHSNEPTIVETLGGDLMHCDRPKGAVTSDPNNRRRWVSYGTPEGGFPVHHPHNDLLDPKMEGSILRYNFNNPDRILFLNSASTVNDWDGTDTTNSLQQSGRGRMKVRISYDDGLTWPRERFLYSGTVPESGPTYANVTAAQNAGRGGYSSMIKLTDSTYGIGAAVEVNEGGATDSLSANRSIDFHRFNIEWILNGQTDGP